MFAGDRTLETFLQMKHRCMSSHELYQLQAVPPDCHRASKKHVSFDVPDGHFLDTGIYFSLDLSNVRANHRKLNSTSGESTRSSRRALAGIAR